MRGGWNRRHGPPGLISLLGLCAGGCAGSEACVDFADEVLVVVSRTDDGRDARVEVELRRPDAGDDSIPAKLCADNSVLFDGVKLAGLRRPNGAVIYEATLDPTTEADPVVHRLTLRSDGEDSVYTAEVDAPGFEVAVPEAGASVSRAAPLAVMWSPVHEGTDITLRLSDKIDGETCLTGAIERVEADDGEATLAAGEITLSPDTSLNATCEAYVTLSRRVTAPLAASSGGAVLHPDSRVEATNSRARRFRSVP